MNRHHMSRRLVAVAACVGATASITALGVAQPALASVKCASEPGFASGSSLQNNAQLKVFLAGWGAHSSCTVAPTSKSITYTKTSSGAGLEEFGNNTSELEPQEDPSAVTAEGKGEGIKDVEGKVLDWFVGTDDPPTAGELSEAQAAAGAKALGEITIPVAQSPVAILLSLPTGCLIPEGSKVDIENTTLPQLWEGTNPKSGSDPGGIAAQGGYAAGTWGALLTQLGFSKTAEDPPTVASTFFDNGTAEGCEQQIKPQVRSVSSGTSYATKNYFAQVNFSVWQQYADDFTNWPTSLKVESDPLSGGGGSQTNETGGKLSANTAATPGSVGYAAASDAAGNGAFTNSATSTTYGTGTGKSPAHQILWAEVQDNGKGTTGVAYADPALSGQEVANCETTKLISYDKGFPYSYTDSWFGIVATDPNIAKDAGAGDYSICALTYDLVWHHYSNTNLYGKTEAAHEVANTVKDLFEYIVGAGQTEIASHYYQRFPSQMQAHINQAVNPGIGY
jgi:hypothetical protein